MQFPNAAKGVKKIFTAQVLELMAGIGLVVTAILSVLTLISVTAESKSGMITAGVGFIAVMLASLVLSAVASILVIVGIVQASKDEGAFKIALVAVILELVASVVMGIFSSETVVYSISHLVSSICSLVSTIYIITGIMNLADMLHNETVRAKGKNILTLIVAIYVLILIAEIVVVVFGGDAASIISGIIALVAAILSVIQYFIYLSYLSKAKNMLAE